MNPKRVEILGVPVDCLTMGSAIQHANNMIREKRKTAILAINPEKVIHCLDNKEYFELIKDAGMLIPDGIGVVIAARMLGLCEIERVPGAELMPNLCELAAFEGYSVYLYGASQEVNNSAVRVIKEQYPGIKIAGSQHGFLAAEETEDFIDRLNALAPDILFVALGSPRQEKWIMENHPGIEVMVCQGVGGTFDVISGNVRRAPGIFRSLHMEWLYRLLAQPKRLIRQTALPRFVFKFIGLLAAKKMRFG